MKIWQLIQILCRLDPDREVFIPRKQGFPYKKEDLLKIDRVYDDYLNKQNISVLTTNKINYKKDKK